MLLLILMIKISVMDFCEASSIASGDDSKNTTHNIIFSKHLLKERILHRSIHGQPFHDQIWNAILFFQRLTN